jgi:hypothetical protein
MGSFGAFTFFTHGSLEAILGRTKLSKKTKIGDGSGMVLSQTSFSEILSAPTSHKIFKSFPLKFPKFSIKRTVRQKPQNHTNYKKIDNYNKQPVEFFLCFVISSRSIKEK